MKTNIFFNFKYFLFGASVALTALVSGCTTTDSSRSSMQEKENILLLREDVNRCKSRLETMEIEQQRILNEIKQLRAKGTDENTRARLDELSNRMSALDAARASDRKAIVDQLSGNMAKMMGASSASRPSRASSAAISSTGYEHIVKDGETLSTIAAAYKTRSSVIIQANNLKNPDLLRKGQKLFIPKQ